VNDLFNSPVIWIEQPRKVLATHAHYKISDAERTLLAVAVEADVRTWGRALRTALPASPPAGAQRLLVSTAGEEPLLVLDKQDGGRLTEIRHPDGELFGAIRARRTTRHYTLQDPGGERIGEVTGDLSLRRFAVTSATGGKVAQVNKKWAGLAAEVLTTADRYNVEIAGSVEEPLRTLIVMTAIVLDLILHESKS
jgi:uncharacterized protein YxjI